MYSKAKKDLILYWLHLDLDWFIIPNRIGKCFKNYNHFLYLVNKVKTGGP